MKVVDNHVPPKNRIPEDDSLPRVGPEAAMWMRPRLVRQLEHKVSAFAIRKVEGKFLSSVSHVRIQQHSKRTHRESCDSRVWQFDAGASCVEGTEKLFSTRSFCVSSCSCSSWRRRGEDQVFPIADLADDDGVPAAIRHLQEGDRSVLCGSIVVPVHLQLPLLLSCHDREHLSRHPPEVLGLLHMPSLPLLLAETLQHGR
mmetsp:Transcript_16850/g.38386  ORF Transcript_16850/g.38386 Transcript_16850/m.38386 type:complete len:200 (-) Transcript_16850:491-1090(-)